MGQQKTQLEFSALLLVVYTSVIVGIAEGFLVPYFLTPFVVLLSVLLTRYWSSMRLNTLAANVLGLLAFFLAAAELFRGTIEARLLAGAHLMVYLTWIVVLQKRQPAHYWWMVALCILQTAIGSVLLNSALYGIFLLVFLIIAMWTLALFSLHRSQLRFLQWTEAHESAAAPHSIGHSEETPSDLLTSSFMKPQPLESSFRAVLLAPSSATGSMQIDTADRWLTVRFVGGILGMSLASVLVGFVFFGLIPRQWLGGKTWGFSDSRIVGQQLIGFSEKVSLDSFGTILASNERVFEVRVFDARGNPVSVYDYATQLGYDEPLFRGHVLDSYEDGVWSRYDPEYIEVLVKSNISQQAFRQEYRLPPLGTRTLFAMRPMPLGPVFTVHTGQRRRTITIEPVGSVIQRNRQAMSIREFTYVIYASKELPSVFTMRSPPWCLEISDRGLQQSLQNILKTEVRLKASDPPRQRARQIVRYLRDSGTFRYTLEIPPRAARDKDPVLEFLQDRQTGHCQYFATALALLLRADGIPSRVVGGFKGGEENNLTGYFDVQQRHAHAWVEADIDGHWITLDATPADRAKAVAKAGSWFEAWKSFFTDFWHKYVTGLDYNNQKTMVFDPLQETANDAWNAASLQQAATSDRWQALKDFVSNPHRWFSWQGGLFSFVIMLFVTGIYWALKRAFNLRRHLQGQRESAGRQRIRVEFYERFTRLCAALGLARHATQTQREFAIVVGERLAEQAGETVPANLPSELTEAFYEIRFGAFDLTPVRRNEIDQTLGRLETSLRSDTEN